MVGPCRFIVPALMCAAVGCGGLAPQVETHLLGTMAATQEVNAQPTVDLSNRSSDSSMAPSAAVLSALGGAIISQPRVQLISFNTDGDAASVQNFLSAWSQSGVWQQMTQEYGIGPLEVAPLLRANLDWADFVMDGASTGDANSNIESAIIANLDGDAPPWGMADSNTVYVLEMPSGVAVAPSPDAASACDAKTLAWHGAVTLPIRNITVTYIVLPACGSVQALSLVDTKTFALSHTLVGAVTDPTGQGFAAIDAAHAAWQVAGQSPEASDLCHQAMYQSGHLVWRGSNVPQALARTWSNVAARSGRAPCVPAIDDEIFLTAAPSVNDTIEVAVGADQKVTSVTTVGLSLAPGAARDVPVVLASYPQNAGVFAVAATEVGSEDLTLTLSSTQGSHGQTLTLHVAVSANPALRQQVVRLTSTQGDVSFSQYFLVRTPNIAQVKS